ncbi:MAG: GGDEF-domain containing protein, partial [Pygmaiobacter sp.]
MQRLFKSLIAFLLAFSLLIGGFTVYRIVEIRSYGALINYVGIVRGATQRLVKLELSGEVHDELRNELDDI